MNAAVHTQRGKFSRWQLGSRWQNGECGTYARALQLLRPDLRIGVLGTLSDPADPASDFELHHFIAHDDRYAYDSLGAHTLPYLGVNNQFNHAYLDQSAGFWGGLEDEHGEEDGEEAQQALGDAVRHIRRHGILAGVT